MTTLRAAVSYPQLKADCTVSFDGPVKIVDSVSLRDTSVVAFPISAPDGVTVADALTYIASYRMAFTDSVSTSDTPQGIPQVFADTVTATDAVVNALSKPVADSAAPTDSSTNGYSAVAVESVTATDASVNAPAPVFADSVTATDSATEVTATFITSGTAQNNTSGQATISSANLSSAAAGDLIIVSTFIESATNNSTFSGATQDTSYSMGFATGKSVILYKLLTSTDVSSGITVTGMSTTANTCGVNWSVYRGPTAIALKNTKEVATGQPVNTGFVKASNSKFVVGILHSCDANSLVTTGTSLDHMRGTLQINGGAGGSNFHADSASSNYANSSTETWTNNGTGDSVSFLYELT